MSYRYDKQKAPLPMCAGRGACESNPFIEGGRRLQRRGSAQRKHGYSVPLYRRRSPDSRRDIGGAAVPEARTPERSLYQIEIRPVSGGRDGADQE